LPGIPAAAILVALLWTDESASQNKSILPFALFNLGLAIVLAAVIFLSPNLLGYDPAVPELKQLLQQSGLPIRGGIIWAATAIGIALLLQKRRWRSWLWIANLLGFAAFVIFVLHPGYFFVDELRQKPLRQFAAIAVQQIRPQEELIMIGFEKPSLVFYTQRPVVYFPNAREAFIYVKQAAASHPNRPSALVLSQSNKLKRRFLKNVQYEELANSNAYRLLRLFKITGKIADD
jgi:hypothetical protein